MKWMRGIAEEIFGLFVDDGYFAMAIVVWLGIDWFLSLYVVGSLVWSGVLLFAGLGLILLQSAFARARR